MVLKWIWAAVWLPLLFGGLFSAAIALGQTSGLPAPVSGDCVTSATGGATGAVVCTKSNGVALAPSAIIDATNAANVTSGVLGLARVPVLDASKLPVGAAGTVPAFDAAGRQTPGVAAPFAAAGGPIKAAPFAVSAQAAAGGAGQGIYAGDTNARVLNLTNGARLETSGTITQVKFYVNDKTSLTGLYYEAWRVNASGTFSLVGRSQNLLSATVAGQANLYTLAAPVAAKAGDYSGYYAEYAAGAPGLNTFTASTAYPATAYPAYVIRNQGMTSTADFVGGTTSALAPYVLQENPIEVYLAQGPVVACGMDSKMQGIPFSGNYLQANFNGTFNFPVAPNASFSTAFPGSQMIDPSNQPCAYIGRMLGYTTANLAVTGATTTAWMANVLPTVLLLKPAVLVVSGTINDVAFGMSTATTVSNMQSIYTQAVGAGVQRVVMTGAEPANYGSDAMWAVMEATNAQMKTWCQGQAQCVWVGDRVMSALGQFRATGPAGNLRNIQPAYASADGLHFLNAGAQMMGLIEAEGIEAPSALGTTVAVAQANGGTRVRQAQPVGADGATGWKWLDTREYLQMEGQMETGAPLTAGAGNPGQQAVGCVVFEVGRGYARCDGQLRWDLQGQALNVPTVNVGTTNVGTVNQSGPLVMNGNIPGAANISMMHNGDPSGGAGFESLSGAGTHVYNFEAFGSGQAGYGGHLGIFDQQLGRFVTQWLQDGTVCFYGGVGACLNAPVVFSPGGNSLTVPVLAAKHVVGVSSGTLTAAAGAAASGCAVTGTDVAFTLSCTTGAAPAAGTLATVTFGGAFGAAPRFAAPGAGNAASAGAALFASATVTGLTVGTGTALAANGSYVWNFVLVQ